MMLVPLLVVLGALGISGAAQVEGNQPSPSKYIYRDATQPINARVADLLSRMNMDEKVGRPCIVAPSQGHNASCQSKFHCSRVALLRRWTGGAAAQPLQLGGRNHRAL